MAKKIKKVGGVDAEKVAGLLQECKDFRFLHKIECQVCDGGKEKKQ